MNVPQRWLLAGLIFFPFTTTIKFPPLGNFWGEWIAAVLAIVLLISMTSWRKEVKAQTALTPLSVLLFIGLAALTALQLSARLIPSAALGALPIGELAIGAALVAAGARQAQEGKLKAAADAMSAGLLIALAINFVAVVAAMLGWQIFFDRILQQPVPDRATGLVGQPNQLAVISAIAWAGAGFRWTTARLGSKAFWSWTVIAALVIAATVSRAGLVCWAAAAGVVYWTLPTRGQSRVGLSAPSLSGTSSPSRRTFWIGVALFVSIQALCQLSTRSLINPNAPDRPLGSRGQLIKEGLRIWKSHPLIGVGFRQYMPVRLSEGTAPMTEPAASHPHNVVVAIAAEYGTIGLAIVFIPLGSVLWSVMRKFMRREVASELAFFASFVLLVLLYSLVEYPLWYTYFLFPFAFALGALPQRVYEFPTSLRSGRVWIMVWALAGVGCVVVLMDYVRLQSIYVDVGRQREATRGVPNAALKIPPSISAVELATLFPTYADNMYARTLVPDGLFMHEKLAITLRAFLGIPSPENLARHVEFLLVEGNTDEADRWLKMAGTRNLTLFLQAVDVLRIMSSNQPKVADYLRTNGLMS